ncbi:putative phosphomannomutase [Actinoplanes missouriensis 431]|uniref:Putative phosphomannomutase n=1 Tax=Actinoplanes missouriensis (strain ATCC 14538 / DSM 43046 / CBS 188.64 / JCM 3121 / NBRC 102363 / NCIMB 12654 / NRRL B-3342 / UNCC 431) TaxID=512565 RepID=I0HI47_ACTM4|nr:phospho-sugar mutase [Actinoplanes missouriensis]BAL92684.1 putative phosphomannomutase [Actinoplanes missouriensis 431]
MASEVDVALTDRAEAWLADDPDPASRAELRDLIDRLPATAAELRDRFSGPLTFGTAGLRGPLRAGPNGMNLAVVTQAAAGLVAWLAAQDGEGPLVIGYDARHGSREFAERTARVATGAGREALLMPRTLPTPVLAYAVRALGAVAGVMVTASHNPPQDNGYKVYLGAALGGPAGDGAQIVPPADAGIEAAIRAAGSLAAVPLGEPGTLLGTDIADKYVRSAAAVLTEGGPRDLRIAYTPLHGVGGETLAAAFRAAGFPAPAVVADQEQPDPEFPTVHFPNPEEPGAMDHLLALAGAEKADLAIANDPDADRCAVAIPAGDGTWRPLRGDELGVLLADHLIRRGVTGTYATTIVSSSLLGRLSAARGVPYAETLTGFKWIVRAAEELAFGYEEALGYCVAPAMVRDKDGITAALTVAELAAELKTAGKTLSDRLDELAAEFGVHATDQLSVRVDDLTEIGRAMTRARQNPPTTLLGSPVTEVADLLPENDVLTFRTSAARVVIRPSGTEPKLKAYLEVVEPVSAAGLGSARQRAAAALVDLRAEIAATLGV